MSLLCLVNTSWTWIKEGKCRWDSRAEEGEGGMNELGKDWLEIGSKPSTKALVLSVPQMGASRNPSTEPRTRQQVHCAFSLSQVYIASSPACWSGCQNTAGEKKLHCMLRLDNSRAGCFLHPGTCTASPFYLFFDFTLYLL